MKFPSGPLQRKANLSYTTQRGAAIREGAEWSLTMAEWWDVWHPYWLGSKGRYRLTRINDALPYQPGNVQIFRKNKVLQRGDKNLPCQNS